MNYDQYNYQIVLRYGVRLLGWPKDLEFKSPSRMHNVTDLHTLRNALQAKTCRWVKLSRQELKDFEADVKRREADGTLKKKERKQRSDRGKRRRGSEEGDEEDEEDEEDEGNGKAASGGGDEDTAPPQNARQVLRRQLKRPVAMLLRSPAPAGVNVQRIRERHVRP